MVMLFALIEASEIVWLVGLGASTLHAASVSGSNNVFFLIGTSPLHGNFSKLPE
jgi:hypothetical protein